MVNIYRTFQHELVKLHHYAVASDIHEAQPGCQSESYHVDSCALRDELSSWNRSVDLSATYSSSFNSYSV